MTSVVGEHRTVFREVHCRDVTNVIHSPLEDTLCEHVRERERESFKCICNSVAILALVVALRGPA